MHFVDLAVYTFQISENRRFRNGDSFIDVSAKGNYVSIDFDNGDIVHIRFDAGKALVKTVVNEATTRKVVTIGQIKSYLMDLDLYSKVANTLTGVPFLSKILA